MGGKSVFNEVCGFVTGCGSMNESWGPMESFPIYLLTIVLSSLAMYFHAVK